MKINFPLHFLEIIIMIQYVVFAMFYIVSSHLNLILTCSDHVCDHKQSVFFIDFDENYDLQTWKNQGLEIWFWHILNMGRSMLLKSI